MATAERNELRRTQSAELIDRVPPQNLEAEQCVLGSMLLDPEVCDDVALAVRAEDFYGRSHQTLFTHVMQMHNEGERVDAFLLIERLKQHGELDAAGGIDYIKEVVNSVPVAIHAKAYADIVRDKATLRSLIHTCSDVLRDAYDHTHDARELLNRAEERVFGVLEERGGGAELYPIDDVLHAAMERIDSRLHHGGAVGGVESGFADLDEQTGGLHNSELVILAARPSMGKTALATNIAEHVAIHQGRATLLVSLEMSRLELTERLLCSRGRINGHKLRKGFASDADYQRLVEVSNDMYGKPLYIDDSPSRTMTEIAATARRLKRREDLALVVIDYLQLIEPDNPKDPRQEQVARIARRLKGLARELKIPVLCLAQLNRQAEASRDNRPRLSHLRESGAIEQDADVVMFVHRDEYYATTEEERQQVRGQADIIVAKQRNGPVGEVKLTWLEDYTRFENRAAGEPFNGDF